MSDAQLVVILHEVEARKTSNTGHLAKLVLPSTKILVNPAHGRGKIDVGILDESRAEDGRPWHDMLLFPGQDAEPLSKEYAASITALGARLRLVVPDGTWAQVRRMVRRIPALARLPRVSLPAIPAFAERDAMRPRGNPGPERVSTCEAMAAAFGILGAPAAEAALFAVYDAAALRIALMRGKLPLRGYRHVLAAPHGAP